MEQSCSDQSKTDLEGTASWTRRCVGRGRAFADFKLVLNVVCFLIRFGFTKLSSVPGERPVPRPPPDVGLEEAAGAPGLSVGQAEAKPGLHLKTERRSGTGGVLWTGGRPQAPESGLGTPSRQLLSPPSRSPYSGAPAWASPALEPERHQELTFQRKGRAQATDKVKRKASSMLGSGHREERSKAGERQRDREGCG